MFLQVILKGPLRQEFIDLNAEQRKQEIASGVPAIFMTLNDHGRVKEHRADKVNWEKRTNIKRWYRFVTDNMANRNNWIVYWGKGEIVSFFEIFCKRFGIPKGLLLKNKS